jgi:hypothetical protein
MTVRRLARLLVALVLVATQFLLFAAIAAAAEIASAGPLTRVIVTPDLACQVAHVADEQLELYGGDTGSCGTFVALGGNVFGPSSGNATTVAYTPVSQAPVSGSGSSAEPFRVLTVADAAQAGVRVQQIDSYVIGAQSYRTDVQLTNGGPARVVGTLYRYGDCYLQNEDTGFGRVDNGSPACIVDPAAGQRIEQWTPLTPGSHFFEGHYAEGYGLIAQQVQFPDTCACAEQVDNGAGLSWALSIEPGQSLTFSQETFFSPTGRGPIVESFASSVPDPSKITLDPVVVAESVAVAAGVILLVPFPSALFNSTLEENYDEVMSGVNRLRRRLRELWLALLGRTRSAIAEQRAARAGRAAPAALGVGASPAATSPASASFDPTAAAGPEATPRASAIVQPSVPGATMLTPMPAPEQVSRDLWRTPLGILVFIGLSALFYSFLDPTFGLSLASLATLLGLGIGLVVILVAYGAPLLLFSRNHAIGLTVRALPATLVIAIICVIVSRVANFQPGYLYGLVVGFFFVSSVSRDIEGKAEAAAAATSLAAAFVAWVVLALLRSGAAGGDDFTNTLLQSATVTIVVAGLENAVFAMLPLRFLPGSAVFDWNRRIWIVLIGLGVFGFAHVLLNPSAGAGYLADTTRTSFFTLVVLLVAFGVVSVAFWAWFRFRPSRPHAGGPAL